jgi:hypothetical protein
MPRNPNVRLEDTMSIDQITDALAKMIFTAAHNWERSVTMDRNTRDAIVRRLRMFTNLEK